MCFIAYFTAHSTVQPTKSTPSHAEVEMIGMRAELINMQTEIRDLKEKFENIHHSFSKPKDACKGRIP